MVAVHHRTVEVDGLTVFYREAGPADAPVLLLLHGYPTSSHMFRHLIPALAGPYRVIAPDHIGFGRSSAPSVEEFPYTFDALAEVTRRMLAVIDVDRYAIYVQDYGAPVGWRLALADPDAVVAVVSQNGNAYEEGFVPEFWAPIWAYGADPSAEHEARLRPALGREAVEWQYTHGVADFSLVDPDAWEHDLTLLARPGVDRAQLALFGDYATNRALYPAVHEWLRSRGVPVLAVWGRNDEIFAPAGAEAFRRDAPDAEILLLDGGHFLLETHLDDVAQAILAFHERVCGEYALPG
ncbi:alpha/beta fold hydrolase [Streptomyces sp. SID8361]|uniref:alpha/beta fold hydrolase n=1 Tax=Streptomyces TaxID=1883 RepID=UPI00081F4CB1|nr:MULTISPECIES: alpha/beta hydrolase [Streptomyces]MYU13577.1 alpha/beta fold hydrolase [Streptomyces sp. SID8361]ATL87918.1 putative hydrolase or acyltransferase of alpha/beta superfamily [Streptomyces malaysiensis]MCQ6250014.1 alpha/beta hydrolase [Streptomyces malaysiensis]QDL68734.1 alpha/beta hydrolase [Streptomyces malaysiensis]SCG01323.1 Pimeloyl-ACP methyl ester carboxylesterase [Streptomyces sp. MnatMP-M27]